jgi:hypothetical protein
VPGGLVPDLVRYRVRPVGQPGDGLGERQRGAFGVGEARRIRQAAAANSRSPVSPAFWALREPESTQELHPLIWLARKWTSASVGGGTPPFSVAECRAWMGCMSSGMITAGFFIRACMIEFLQRSSSAWLNRDARHSAGQAVTRARFCRSITMTVLDRGM